MQLVERLLSSVESLEPRGLSMTAYSAAKLLFGDHRSTGSLAAGTTHGVHPTKRVDIQRNPRNMCFFGSNLDFSAMKQMLTLSIIILNHTYILHVLCYGLFYIRFNILSLSVSLLLYTIIIITTIVSIIIHDYYYHH